MRILQFLFWFLLLSAIAAPGQNQFEVLHAFTGGSDGGGLWGSLAFDTQGNLYGTTSGGGEYGFGAVFQLSPTGQHEWQETALHSFCFDCGDGCDPQGSVTFDGFGNLYSTTVSGGSYGWGTVFELTPGSDGWSETLLYSFSPQSGGAGSPSAGLIRDAKGNLYGGAGPVFELVPGPTNWTEFVLHNFDARNGDGSGAGTGLIMDSAGNLYGTTGYGGGRGNCMDHGCGTVYELQPKQIGVWGPGVKLWKERILYRFGGIRYDGKSPAWGS